MTIAGIDDFSGEYAFLSNFYPSPMTFEEGEAMGIWPLYYLTVEHGFQAAKARTLDAAVAIASCTRPGEAKRAGRRTLLRDGWEVAKFPIMGALLRKKFSDPELRDQLLSTSPAMLREGNTWHDQVWGDCVCGRIPCQVLGDNHLGRLLMKIRREILAGNA